MNRFLAFAALAVGGYFAFAAFQGEPELGGEYDLTAEELANVPENFKPTPEYIGDEYETDWYSELLDMFNRVSAYTQEEINYFSNFWTNPQ